MCSRPRKPQRKPKPSAGGRLRLVDQRGVVQPKLVQRVAQLRVVVAVQRVQAGEHHRPGVRVTGQRLGRRPGGAGHRVADPGLPDVLDPGDEVADLARAEAVGRDRLRRDDAHLERVVRGPGGHHQALLPPGQAAVHHPDVGDHAPVGVVDRVEDQRAGRRVRVAAGRRDLRDDRVEQVRHAVAGLGRDPQHVAGVAADDAGPVPRRTGPAGPQAGRSCSAPGSGAGRRPAPGTGWPASAPRCPGPRPPAGWRPRTRPATGTPRR